MMSVILRSLVIAGLAALSPLASAQQHGNHGGHHGAPAKAAYSGQDVRSVASFSEEDLKGHLEGRGLGYARPAEFNGYPGPMHILELKADLSLTPEQVSAVEKLFSMMQDRARRAGQQYIASEKALDQAFRAGVVDLVAIKRLTVKADRSRAETRFAHLEAHVEARSILTEDQRKTWNTRKTGGAWREPTLR